MVNTLGNYVVPLYAQQALMSLENALGMASRVYMGYDEERRSFGQGDTINIRKPGEFTAQDFASAAQAITTKTHQMTLAYHREVLISLSDTEVAKVSPRLMEDEIPRAAYAIAQDIDSKLWALYKDVPWLRSTTGTTIAVADVAAASRILEVNQAPIYDQANMFAMIGPEEREALSVIQAFSEFQGSGDKGVGTQATGQLGMRYGFNFMSSQNRPTHTPGVSADALGDVQSTVAAGLKSIVVENLTAAGTVKKGDTFVIAGNTQRYAITADATASGGVITLAFEPALVATATAGDDVTIDLEATKVKQNLFFHRHAFAVAFGKLPDYGQDSGLGAAITSLQAPSGVAVRVRKYYDGHNLFLGVDALFGVSTLNGNLACRVRQA